MGLPAAGWAFLHQSRLNTLATDIPTGQPDLQSLPRAFPGCVELTVKTHQHGGRRPFTLKPEHPGTTIKCSAILWELPSDSFPKMSTSIISRKGSPTCEVISKLFSQECTCSPPSRVSLCPSPLDWKGWLLKAGRLLQNWKGGPLTVAQGQASTNISHAHPSPAAH